MNINNLILIIKKKIKKDILVDEIKIEDKTFLHKKHKGFIKNKYHLKLYIVSAELKKMSRIESTKKIYKILDEEMRQYIHSIQILIS